MTDPTSSIERFRARLDEARPPTGGVALDAVVAEVAPVLPLLEELPPSGNFESFEFRECLTVLTLLGRRLALLDLTPTAAMRIVELALAALEDAREASAPRFVRPALTAVVEGFVMGREERVEEDRARRASCDVRPLRIDDDVFALIVSGVHDAEALGEFVDALGRAMLDADAGHAIVDLAQLGEPDRERARAIFSADEVTRMLGASCVFSGVDAGWRAAAAEAQIDLGTLRVAPTLAQGLAGLRSGDRPPDRAAAPAWRALLGRLRR